MTTTTTTTALDLDAIKARTDAATPGPWETGDNWVFTEPVYDDDKRQSNVLGMTYYEPERAVEERHRAQRNVEFIAHAREDVPALVAEVEQLRAKLDQPCGSCHPCTNYADETWREANRKPPHVFQWDELRAEVERLREENARLCAEQARPLTDNERAFQDGA